MAGFVTEWRKNGAVLFEPDERQQQTTPDIFLFLIEGTHSQILAAVVEHDCESG